MEWWRCFWQPFNWQMPGENIQYLAAGPYGNFSSPFLEANGGQMTLSLLAEVWCGEPFSGNIHRTEFRGSILQAAQSPASKGHGRSLVVPCVWATQQAGGIAGVCKDFTCFSYSCQESSSSAPGESAVSVTLCHPDKCQMFTFTFSVQ